MTRAADVPPLVTRNPTAAVQALRAAGLRISTARRLVIEALFEARGAVSAAQLAQTLTLDESSVYRNLEVLERHGLVRHLHLGHGAGLYMLVANREVEYLYCEKCDQITSVAPERIDPIREQIRKEFGHHARFTHFAIVGVCAACNADASC